MYWGLNMYYNTLEKILSSHPPRSLIASSNLFSFMAVCTNLVCKLWNKQTKKKNTQQPLTILQVLCVH